MKTYTVQTKFVFAGAFEVHAENMQEARRIVEQDCGVVLGGKIHTTASQAVIDWEFPVHPEKRITSVKERKRKRNPVAYQYSNE